MADLLLYRQTIQEAARAAGGPAALSERLDVSIATVERWISGERLPPTRYFLLAVDILHEANGQQPLKRAS